MSTVRAKAPQPSTKIDTKVATLTKECKRLEKAIAAMGSTTDPLSDLLREPGDGKPKDYALSTVSKVVDKLLKGQLQSEEDKRLESDVVDTSDSIAKEVVARVASNPIREITPVSPATPFHNKENPEVEVLSDQTIAKFRSLEGRILTIADGIFADKVQRDAVKTLIKKEFRRTMGE